MPPKMRPPPQSWKTRFARAFRRAPRQTTLDMSANAPKHPFEYGNEPL